MQYFKSRTSLTIIWILLVVANGLVTVHYLTSGAAWFAGAATATSAAILFYLRQNKNVSLSPSGPVFYGLYAGFFFLLASAIVTGAPPIIVAGILLTALTSLNTVFSQQEQTNWRVITLFITFVILFSFVVRAFSLSVYPSYNYHDEPWILSFIVGYIEEGMFVDRIMLGLDPEITTWAMPKHYIPVAWWMELAGIGIWQGRFYHMMLAVVTTLLTAITAGKLYNRKVALFTALFMAGSTVLTFTFQFRHEAPLTLSIAASLLCFSLATERNNNWLHLLAGMVMGAGGFGHLNAALFGGVMLVGLYTPLWITRLRQQLWWPPRSMIAYGVGGMVSGLLVLWIVVLPDYEHLAHYYAPRVTEEGNNFLVGTGIHLTNIMLHSITEFALLLIALVVAARRSMQSDWSLIVIFSMGILVLGIASPAGIFQYVRPLVPVYGILVGALFGTGVQHTVSGVRQYGIRQTASALLILTVPLFQMLTFPLRFALSDAPIIAEAPPAVVWLQDNVACDSVIVNGPSYYYFWLYDAPFPYSSIQIFEYLTRTLPYANKDSIGVWQEIQPHYVVINPALPTYQHQELITPDFLFRQDFEVIETVTEGNSQVIIYYHRERIHQTCTQSS